eukprot:TRINITY_DN17473_c1_g1_i1.p1 TRINITY_DN17473_c1_g1~~TRINITY_DN17473_c1_g1_i1.p1  ORF type:complete len:235 (+),score=56.92 TRINITY_DN17473_c1_g1_i1:118-822(+)
MSFKRGVDSTYHNKDRVRGGAGDFTWDQLKGDKLAAIGEYYLGRSQMCENIWYGKDRTAGVKAGDREKEISDIKAQEQEMMAQAMGLQPTKRRQTELTAADEKALLTRNKPTNDDDHLGLGLNIHAKKASAQLIANTGTVPEDLRKSSTYEVSAHSLKGNIAAPDAAPAQQFLAEDQIVDGVNYTAIDAILKEREREKKDKKKRKKEKEKKKKSKKKDKKKKKRRRSSSTDSSS